MTETITQLQAADIVGVTPRRMRQIDNEDTPPQRNGDGLYPCDAFGQWLRTRIEADFVTSSDGTIYDLEAERARLAHHQANLAAMEEEVKRKNLIPADVVESRWQSLAANVRAKLLNLPGRGAVAVAGLSTVQEIERELRRLVYEALRELAAGK